ILHFGEKETRGQTKQSLGPNESFDQSLSLPIGDLQPGRWPFQLRVDYTDANQYPFQALQVNAVLVGQPPPAKMTVPLVKPDPLATTSPLHVRLKNLTGTPRTVAVSVLVPEGLDVAEPIQPVALAGWEDKPVTAQLVNRSALPAANIPSTSPPSTTTTPLTSRSSRRAWSRSSRRDRSSNGSGRSSSPLRSSSRSSGCRSSSGG